VLSLALKLILLALFVPVELSFFLLGLRLTVTRLILLMLVPVVIARMTQKIAVGQYRFVASDLFIVMASLWMFIGPAVTNGFADALEHSGPVALEYMMAYMSTRILLSGTDDSLRFVEILCMMISLAALDATLDSFTSRYITHEILGGITGMQYIGYNSDNYRYGLLRAAGPLEHPILFGTVCAIGLLVGVAIKIRWKMFCIAACGLGLVISISSAPQQSALMGLAFLVYSRVFVRLPHKWLLLSVIPVGMGVALFLATPTPFGHLFEWFTLNPSTAYYRLYIWNSVGPAILENPFFTVLEGNYEYQGSVDSLWLALALSYGIPCGILTALSMVGCCSLPTGSPRARLSAEEERLGTVLGIIIFLIIFMSFTVDFWGPTWILVGLLVGVRAHLGEMGRLNLVEKI
jgi:hypothetical protein